MLYRKIESLIEEHLKSDSKKILLIDGARQIGKTYIINHVGKKLFENYIQISNKIPRERCWIYFLYVFSKKKLFEI